MRSDSDNLGPLRRRFGGVGKVQNFAGEETQHQAPLRRVIAHPGVAAILGALLVFVREQIAAHRNLAVAIRVSSSH